MGNHVIGLTAQIATAQETAPETSQQPAQEVTEPAAQPAAKEVEQKEPTGSTVAGRRYREKSGRLCRNAWIRNFTTSPIPRLLCVVRQARSDERVVQVSPVAIPRPNEHQRASHRRGGTDSSRQDLFDGHGLGRRLEDRQRGNGSPNGCFRTRPLETSPLCVGREYRLGRIGEANIFRSSMAGGVFKSTDAGNTWTIWDWREPTPYSAHCDPPGYRLDVASSGHAMTLP